MSELKLFHTKNTYVFPDKDIVVADQESLDSLDQELQYVKGNISDIQESLSDVENAIVDTLQDIEDLRTDVDLVLDAKLEDVQDEIDEINNTIENIQDEIDQIKSIVVSPWTDVIPFKYSNSNNIHPVTFTPNSVGYAILNGVSLNPYIDYYFENKTVVLKTELLTQDIEYILIIQYFK